MREAPTEYAVMREAGTFIEAGVGVLWTWQLLLKRNVLGWALVCSYEGLKYSSMLSFVLGSATAAFLLLKVCSSIAQVSSLLLNL